MISNINIQVDRDLCFACGLCVERCIMDNLRLSLAPCRTACPLDLNCQGYVRLIAQGREREAAEEMRLRTPFGAILGRVCSQPCEAACERAKDDGAVHIRALKRYLAEACPDIAARPPLPAGQTGLRAAVVGSGPAGLCAAYELRALGHQVTVFEAAGQPGGLLRYGIPSFRLPLEVVDEAIGFLEEMGVVFQAGQALGAQVELDRLRAEYGAVILALGAGRPLDLDIPGQELRGVVSGLDLLRQVKEGRLPWLGRSAAVIGGGNAALDAALTCRKMGLPEVRIVCLEARDQMPAFELEIREALEEGVTIDNGWGPKRIVQLDNDGLRVELARCLALFDGQGAFRPVLEESCGLSLEVDSVVVAIGQGVRTEGLPAELLDPATGRLAADPLTRQSPAESKVFACGDAASGPASVVEAMASGRAAAVSADRLLRGEGLRWGRDFWSGPFVRDFESDHARAKGGPRRELERLAVGQRTLTDEVERVLPAGAAREEAERCLSCGRAFEANQTCWYCLPCEIECPVEALRVRLPYQIR